MKNEESQTTKNSNDPRFAAAVQPITSSTIHTDREGLICGPTTVPSQGDNLPAYVAKPEKHAQPMPVILVVQEIFGVHEHIQDLCRRLAHQGYLAIAPELYFRQGEPQQYESISDLLEQIVTKVPDRQVLSDLDHTAHWAMQHGGDPARLGITGFCWGGRISWLYAAHNPQLKAAVAWYGKFTADKTLTSPQHPVDIAAQLTAPVLGLYGAKDKSIPQDSVELMRQALRAANSDSEIIVYPDAGHAFNADYRPNYHAESAVDGWKRMLNWFKTHGVC